MSNKVYKYLIGPNSVDSHQISPECVLTILRWSNRSTADYKTINGFSDPLHTRDILVIQNDCISLNISNSKSASETQLSAVLLGGDLNYATAVAPGDYIIANILNWGADADIVAANAKKNQPINNFEDGFKGIFRIQTCRRRIVTMLDGKKQVVYDIHALGFSEFQTKQYYNPAISAAFKTAGTQVSQFAVGDDFANFLKANPKIQDILPVLFTVLIGKDVTRKDKRIPDLGKTHYKLPTGLGGLLGRKMTYASDLFNYYIGVWGSFSGSLTTAKKGFNSTFKTPTTNMPHIYTTLAGPLQGFKFINYSNWDQNTSWGIIQSYINETINEIYVTNRISPEGYVLPSVVVRQKPFTSDHFQIQTKGTSMPLTRFSGIPRWQISPDLIYDLDLGRDEAARINFVQIFTWVYSTAGGATAAGQIGTKNFRIDENDILRSGLRPYITSANFDVPFQNSKITLAPMWSEVVADWLFGGHLKENGKITCAGIMEPIAVGDNLELDKTIYQIESINHTLSVDGEGRKDFKTVLTVSFGVSVDSNRSITVYPQMENPSTSGERTRDYEHEKIMPGYSDSEDIHGRANGEKIKEIPDTSFTPFHKKDETVTVFPNDKEFHPKKK
jgi:hypothetical protein